MSTKIVSKIDRSRSARKKGCIERYTIVEREINVEKLIILTYIYKYSTMKETKVEYRFRYIDIKKVLDRIMEKKKKTIISYLYLEIRKLKSKVD